MSLSTERIAIVTGRYFHEGQVVINRHIDELNRGDNCVICFDRSNDELITKNAFFRSELKRNIFEFPFQFANRIRNFRSYHSGYVPVGYKKQMLQAFLKEQKVGKILVEFGNLGPSVWPIAKEMNIPVYVYFRGYDATGYLDSNLRGKRRRSAYKVMFENIDGVFAVSQFLLDRINGLGVHHTNSHVIPSGVDTSMFKLGAKKKGSIASIGRFIEKKAPQLTIKVFARIAQSFPHASLTMVGEGDLLDECKRLAADLGVKGKVEFPGAVRHDQVAELLSRCDIYLQHSVKSKNGDSEGVPTALQEAMAAGCAVVSTRHAGIPEIVENGRTGLLVNEYDAASFGESIQRLLNSPANSRRLGEAAREYALENLEYRVLYRRLESVMNL